MLDAANNCRCREDSGGASGNDASGVAGGCLRPWRGRGDAAYSRDRLHIQSVTFIDKARRRARSLPRMRSRFLPTNSSQAETNDALPQESAHLHRQGATAAKYRYDACSTCSMTVRSGPRSAAAHDYETADIAAAGALTRAVGRPQSTTLQLQWGGGGGAAECRLASRSFERYDCVCV